VIYGWESSSSIVNQNHQLLIEVKYKGQRESSWN
jgi:hypothetical protein